MHLLNNNEGTLQLHHKSSDRRLTLRPGVNKVSDEDCVLFEALLAKQENLTEVQPMNDIAESKANVEVEESEEVKETKKSRKKKQVLEAINE